MKTSAKLSVALLGLSLVLLSGFALQTSAQGTSPSFGLTCPFLGGTCEALPQLPGYIYAFRSSGNAIISAPTPETSPAAPISCLRLLPTTGQVTVTIIAPDGQRATLSVPACPGFDSDGPAFQF
ncbi:MAG: hypothetical protein AAGD06_23845 [Acidobacteriota bacterium]